MKRSNFFDGKNMLVKIAATTEINFSIIDSRITVAGVWGADDELLIRAIYIRFPKEYEESIMPLLKTHANIMRVGDILTAPGTLLAQEREDSRRYAMTAESAQA